MSSSDGSSSSSSSLHGVGRGKFVHPRSVRGRYPMQRPSRSENIMQKLISRETFGKVRSTSRSSSKVFSRLPGRLAFCLREVVPQSAIEAGHIFLGFSKCGQFLISYTHTAVDLDLSSSELNINYHYRLHWWLFVPYRRAKKVSEVMLFTNHGVPGNVYLSVCYWPNDCSKVLVFGSTTSDGTIDDPMDVPTRCYITVTAVPSVKGCKECAKVAASYEEDEMAEAWNSCVRLSCLEHGMTVHTNFDLVRPHPKFEPRISLKRDGVVVINTGNFLHSLRVELETLTRGPAEHDHRPSVSPSAKKSWSELCIGASEEFTLSCLGATALYSPPFIPPTSDSEGTTDCESDIYPVTSFPQPQYNQERLEKIGEFAERLSFSPMVARKFKQINEPMTYAVEEGTSTRKTMAEKAYELTDDDFNETVVQEKLSTFRKKRLAEKKYEFKDEDSENIGPLPRLRKPPDVPDIPPDLSSDHGEKVLRPLNSINAKESKGLLSVCEVEIIESLPVPELLSPGGMVNKRDQSMTSPRQHASSEATRCHAKFTRRYIELDDEMISVITDIEDDDFGVSGGYHSALPLEVHGTGYQSMAMISNAKAASDRLKGGRCINIQQRSLDLDQLCHDHAQKQCMSAGRKFWFIKDYDVEIVDVDPQHGDVICVAVILVQSSTVSKRTYQYQKYAISSVQRNQYQVGFKFSWNIDTGKVNIIDPEPLRDVTPFPDSGSRTDIWHPARSICSNLQRSLATLSSQIRVATNEAVVRGKSLQAIVDSEHLIAIILDKLD